MKIEYRYFKERGYLICNPAGVLSKQDVQEYVQSLKDNAEITAPFMEIADLSAVTSFEFGYFETSELVAQVKSLRELKGYKGSCLVVQNDLTRSMSNIVSEVGRELGVPIKTFKTLEDACKYAEHIPK